MDKHWFVVQAYSGFESQVKRSIEENIKLSGFEDKFGEVLVPTEEILEIRAGKKRRSLRRFFPGYVLIKMVMDDDTWHFIRKIPKVLGFVGGRAEHPTPISEKEAMHILQRIQDGADKPKPKVLFEPGEIIRVTEGPFADFNGAVEEVNYDKNRLKVAVLIFGRSTPVDLDFSQVEKG